MLFHHLRESGVIALLELGNFELPQEMRQVAWSVKQTRIAVRFNIDKGQGTKSSRYPGIAENFINRVSKPRLLKTKTD